MNECVGNTVAFCYDTMHHNLKYLTVREDGN
jgi:hypothetical protein